MSRLPKVIALQTYRQTDGQTRPKLYTALLRRWWKWIYCCDHKAAHIRCL